MQVTVITDAQGLGFMKMVDVLLLGCDALVTEGVVNKVGSGLLALAAKEHGVPVMVVGDSLKVCPGYVMDVCLPKLLGAQEGLQEEKGWQELLTGWKREDMEAVTRLVGEREEAVRSSSKGGHERGNAGEAAAASTWGGGRRGESGNGEPGSLKKGFNQGGSITVRNVYFEVVPWDLVSCLVTEEGAVSVGEIVKKIHKEKQKYLAAFDLVVA
jgi:translation initiation factor 2B subunit (eIF-2B alpha/beta/delta family)